MGRVAYKAASDPGEFEQIHALNYRTFVEEIPQHPPNNERKLVDKFHAENTYLVAKADATVVGMIAVRGNRPFSLDAKLANLDEYLPIGYRPCELRLLAVLPAFRTGRIFHGLLTEAMHYCLAQGYSMALISGTLRQRKLYRHVGFVPFGPVVGTREAPYQPMYLTQEAFFHAMGPRAQAHNTPEPKQPEHFSPPGGS